MSFFLNPGVQIGIKPLHAARDNASGDQGRRLQAGKLLLAGRIAIACPSVRLSLCTHLKPHLSRQGPCQIIQTLLHPQAALIKPKFYVSFFLSDPNKGNSEVPVTWPPYSNEGTYYLEINNKMNQNSVKQNLKSRYVDFWNSVYRKLPQVANITLTEELLWN